MSGKRKSMLLYFDNFHRVAGLPDEQLGILFRALMECGELESSGQDGITGFEERYPGMSDRTQMAFLFMADTIRRDAAAYAEKCANYRSAAQRRAEQRESQAIPPDNSSPDNSPRDNSRPDELTLIVDRNKEARKKRERPDWAAL